jgi:hypothetical protein
LPVELEEIVARSERLRARGHLHVEHAAARGLKTLSTWRHVERDDRRERALDCASSASCGSERSIW